MNKARIRGAPHLSRLVMRPSEAAIVFLVLGWNKFCTNFAVKKLGFNQQLMTLGNDHICTNNCRRFF
jgi:hypothetical protein